MLTIKLKGLDPDNPCVKMSLAVMSTESISNRLKIISDIQDEINKSKVVYDESLEEDETYQEIQKEVEQNNEYIRERKTKVLANPQYVELTEQLKDLRRDLKENREALSQELADYYRDSGKLEIVDHNGETKLIKFSVRLING